MEKAVASFNRKTRHGRGAHQSERVKPTDRGWAFDVASL